MVPAVLPDKAMTQPLAVNSRAYRHQSAIPGTYALLPNPLSLKKQK